MNNIFESEKTIVMTKQEIYNNMESDLNPLFNFYAKGKHTNILLFVFFLVYVSAVIIDNI